MKICGLIRYSALCAVSIGLVFTIGCKKETTPMSADVRNSQANLAIETQIMNPTCTATTTAQYSAIPSGKSVEAIGNTLPTSYLYTLSSTTAASSDTKNSGAVSTEMQNPTPAYFIGHNTKSLKTLVNQSVDLAGNVHSPVSSGVKSNAAKALDVSNQAGCTFYLSSATGANIDVDDCLRVSTFTGGLSGTEVVWYQYCGKTAPIRVVGSSDDVLRITMWDVTCCGCGHSGFRLTNISTNVWTQLLAPFFCNPEYPDQSTCSTGPSGVVPCCPSCGTDSNRSVIYQKRIGDILSNDGSALVCNPPTFTPSTTALVTATFTDTDTETPSPSVSCSETPTATPSAVTDTPTISATPTTTGTVSPTATATVTYTSTHDCPAISYSVDHTDYSQGNPTWAQMLLDHSTKTIGSKGCFLTCFSILSGQPPNVLDQTFTNSDPVALNDVGDFDSVRGAIILGWHALDRLPYSEDVLSQTLQGSSPPRVVVEVQNGPHHHFVVVTGQEWDPATGRCRFTISDPGHSERIYLDAYTTFHTIRRFE